MQTFCQMNSLCPCHEFQKSRVMIHTIYDNSVAFIPRSCNSIYGVLLLYLICLLYIYIWIGCGALDNYGALCAWCPYDVRMVLLWIEMDAGTFAQALMIVGLRWRDLWIEMVDSPTAQVYDEILAPGGICKSRFYIRVLNLISNLLNSDSQRFDASVWFCFLNSNDRWLR